MNTPEVTARKPVKIDRYRARGELLWAWHAWRDRVPPALPAPRVRSKSPDSSPQIFIQTMRTLAVYAVTVVGLAAIICLAASAQSLPPTSRTVYKCIVAGKSVYSDAPCLGAQRIDVEPTRGLDASSGRAQVGADVARERQREALADALKPLTGMNAKQMDTFGRRTKLAADAQRECGALDGAVSDAERDETGEPTGPSRSPGASVWPSQALSRTGLLGRPLRSIPLRATRS